MSLHPQVIALLRMLQTRDLPPMEAQAVEDARASYVRMSQTLNKREEVAKIVDRNIQGFKKEIGIRIYHPNIDKQLPALVYFHGGGWVIGDLNTHDPLCRQLSNEAQCTVISVDYSLSPEQKFPVAVEDAYIAAKWVSDHADELSIQQKQIAVAGDSAGGNLAVAVSYLTVVRNAHFIKYQMLFYPSTGYEKTASYDQYGEGYYLTKTVMSWFRKHYLNSRNDTLNPLAAPILIPQEQMAQLPPAYIVTAEYDPLRDGGENLAMKFSEAGVETTYICYKGMIHGFMCMTEALEDGKRAIQEAAEALKNKLR